jgi:hypothetical protein
LIRVFSFFLVFLCCFFRCCSCFSFCFVLCFLYVFCCVDPPFVCFSFVSGFSLCVVEMFLAGY